MCTTLAACETADLRTSAGAPERGVDLPPMAPSTPPSEAPPAARPTGDATLAPGPLDASPDGPADAAPEPAREPDAQTAPPTLPECPCFVRAAWCGASAGEHGLTRTPACRVPLLPEHDEDLLGCDGATWIVLDSCDEGCFSAPEGTADACNEVHDDEPTPEAPGWPDCASRPLLRAGLHPEASDRLRCAGVEADQISQTIGNAAASAGYHAEDGEANGEPYCAAVDLRTRGLDHAEIRALLDRLAEHGFAGWYRQPGADGWPADEAPHIHAIFVSVRMKAALCGQVRDFLAGRNGLSSHREYGFWRPSDAQLDRIRLVAKCDF